MRTKILKASGKSLTESSLLIEIRPDIDRVPKTNEQGNNYTFLTPPAPLEKRQKKERCSCQM